MKKILFLFIWLLAAIAVEAQTFTYFFRGAELDYEITDEGARTCLVQGWKSGGNVIIPETVSYQDKSYTVVGIGSQAFKDCSSLSSVTIPNSVTTIGESAFWKCYNLSSVTIPNSVTEIGAGAFCCCDSLSSVTIPNSVTTIGDSAFSQCPLSSVTIPNSVTTIGNAAFIRCGRLESVTIGNSVTTIGEHAFAGCVSLSSVTMGNSVTTIGESAFRSCGKLSSVTIPNSVTTIGESAFWSCYNLSSVTIPNSVTTIGESTFLGCYKLSSVTIPNSVTEIGESAFYYCSSLSSVSIPNSVTEIGASAFEICTSLSSVTIPNSVTTIGESAFYGCIRLSSVTIPNSVTTIGEQAFSNCENLKEIYYGAYNPVVAPDNLFSNYSRPTLYVRASALNKIHVTKPWAFFEKIETYDSSGIGLDSNSLSMYVGDIRTLNVTVDGNLSELTWTSSNPDVATVDSKGTVTALAAGEATITVSATDLDSNESVSATCAIEVKEAEIRLENSSLSMCVGDIRTLNVIVGGKLSELTWTSSNPEVATVDSKGTVTALAAGEATITVSAIDLYTNKTVNTTCKVKVDDRGNYSLIYSYSDNSTATVIGLTAENSVDVLIPDAIENDGKHYTVTGIKSSAFAGNGLLRAVTIPSTVNNIEPASFNGCPNLETVNYNPVSVSTTNSHHSSPVFGNCPKFKDLNIGETVKEIPKYMFKTTDIETLNIPDNVTSLLSDCFADCYNLTEIRLGRGVTTIDCAAFAFGSSSGVLTKVYCNAEEISYYRGLNGGTSQYMPFRNRRVSSIEFGPDVERLDDYAFSDISVDDIYCHGEIPPVVGNSSVLKSVDKSKCRLHVPVESLQLYRNANFWKDFYTILSDISGVDGIVVEDNTPMEVYNLNGLKVGESLEGLASGLYIVRQGMSVRKVAVR